MSVRADFDYAVRTLRKSPVYSITAILTIALSIGASAAIFSIVNAVLLRPLPYADRSRLVLVQSDMTARNVTDFPMAPGDLPDLREQGTMFEEVAALVTGVQPLLSESGEPQLIRTAFVTPNLFRTLGGRIVTGRDFVADDGTPAAAPPAPVAGAAGTAAAPPPPPLPAIAILSHELWQSRFGGDPAIIGRRLTIGNQSAEVVGVIEPGFELLWPASLGIERHPEMYTAMRLDFANASRINVFLRTVGRLREGVSIAQAQHQVDGIVADLRRRFPIKETAGVRWRVEPMHAYMVADVRPALLALMGAVLFVLLIGCANVANLQLVRAAQRERELAVRAALGGSRWVLLRQMLVESLVLAGAGAVLGIGLAWGGMRLLIAVGPRDIPRLDQVGLDPLVLGFALAAAALSAALFGAIPALKASRVDVADVIRTGGRNAALAAAARWLRGGVVVAEVALAFVLLVGAGLMIRSFVALHRTDPGFTPQGLLTFQVPNLGRPTAEGRAAFMRQLRERLEALPGVSAVSSTGSLPLTGQQANTRYGLEGALTDPALFQQADMRIVQPGYFATMGTQLIEGRDFIAADGDSGVNRAIVDDVFARKVFQDERAVGRRFLARVGGPVPEWYEIVGVVRHQRAASLAAEGRETVYLPDGAFGFGAAFNWTVRASSDLEILAQAVRSEIRALDPRLAIADMQSMATIVDRARAPTRFALICLGVFAAIAAFLAGVGLYGVLSTVVRQRTPEIGVRMAFGATSQSIFGLVVGQGMALAGGGIVLGVLAAVALTRILGSMLVGVGATDPPTFVAIGLGFLAIAALACWLPALRASRLDPAVALRDE